ncbi:hypothetical protein M0R04_09730 [Candidatus Dojkabacteria bacterium]|jgi:hypothetical protein|nr:hypothetical protein [Candidatus Dojkabacteria bacterium]
MNKETIKWTGKDGLDRSFAIDEEAGFFGGVCYAKDFQKAEIEFYYDDAQFFIDHCNDEELL